MVLTNKNGSRKLLQALAIGLICFLLVLPLLLKSEQKAEAAESTTLNFQARILNSSGSVVPDGNYHIEFKIYDVASGGSALWTETRSTGNLVTVKNGYLSVNLGSVTAFGALDWNEEHWLTMNIGGAGGAASYDGEMSPRIKLTATPYSLQAGQLAKTSGANRGTLSFGTVANNPAIVLPDASGTVCLQSAAACGFVLGTGTAFLQGGNSFGAAGDLGTNDNNPLNIRTNNATRLTVSTSGDVQWAQGGNRTLNIQQASSGAGNNLTVAAGQGASGQIGGALILQGGANGTGSGTSGSVIVRSNGGNSANAFQIQNSSSVNVFNADTVNNKITVTADADFTTNFGNRFFSESFESGDLLLWNGWSWNNPSSVAIDTSTVRSGEYSLKVTVDGQHSRIGFNTPSSPTTAYLRGYVNVESGSQSADTKIMALCFESPGDGVVSHNDGACVSVLRQNSDGSIDVDNEFGTDPTSSTAMSAGAWHLLEMKVVSHASAGEIQVWLDGASIINSTGLNTGGSGSNYVLVGDRSTNNMNFWIDDMSMDSVATGPSQNVNIGDSLHVSGTATFGTNTTFKNDVFINNGSLIFNDGTRGGNDASLSGDIDLFLTPGGNGSGVYVQGNRGTFNVNAGEQLESGYVPLTVKGTTASASNIVEFKKGSTTVASIASAGAALFKNETNSTTAFRIQNAGGSPDTLLTANTTNNRITIGNATGTDTDTTLLVVDSATADPTSSLVNGSIFYNSTTNKFRCRENGAWADCIPASAGTAFLQGGNDFGTTTAGTLGTINNGVLNIITNNTTRLTITTGGDLQFAQGGNRTINIAQASSGAGNNLTIAAGQGASGQLGGNLILQGGANGTGSGTTGSVIVRANGGESTGAFQVQNSASTPLIVGDTSNMRVGILTAPGSIGAKLHVTGDMIVDNDNINGNGAAIAYIQGTVNSSTGGTEMGIRSLIENAPTSTTNILQGYYMELTDQTNLANTTEGIVIKTVMRGTSNKTVHGLLVDTSDVSIGGTMLGYTALFKGFNSTTAFQIQNASSTPLFNVDSTNTNITIGANTGDVRAWSNDTTGTISARDGANTVVLNGYVYTFGGCQVSGGGTQTSQYAQINADGSLGSWGTTTIIPTATCIGGGAATANGRIYVTTFDGSDIQTHYAKPNLDGTISSWTTSSVVVSSGYDEYGLTSYNNYLYLVGGDGPITTVRYAKVNPDGSISSWSTTSALSAATKSSQPVVANGYLYMAGGAGSGSGADNDVQRAKINADGTLGTWTNQTNLLPANRHFHTTLSLNGHLYVIGGSSDFTNGNNTVYYAPFNADGSVGSFSTSNSTLPANRWVHSGFVANGYLYTISGTPTNDASAANTTYYTSGSRVQVAGALDLIGISGENLSEGSTGGQLYAGDTYVAGTFKVTSSAHINGPLTVEKDLAVTGQGMFKNSTNSTTALQLQSAGDTLLTGNTTNNRVVIGNATGTDTDTTLLVVDSATADPTTSLSNGSMYYNSTNNKFRCRENGAWADCIPAAGASPWTTDSNVVNLNTDGDTVTIGSNTAGGKLFIDGDANEVQLQIQGVSGQTAELLLLEQHDGTDVLTVSNAGNLDAAGTLAVGTSDAFTVAANGNVVIKTVQYGQLQFDRQSATDMAQQILFSQQGANRFVLGTDLDANNTRNFFIWDSVTNTPRIFIASDGKIGLGTNVPTADLTFTEGADRTINVLTRTTNAAGNNLNIAAGTGGAGNNNGGNLLLQGGANTGAGTAGSVIVRSNGGNSVSAFQVQNSSSSPVMTVDTTNSRVGIGDDTPLATLTVGSGDLFQVAGATGNITTSGDVAVNGGDVTSTTSLNVTASNGALTLTSTGSNNDIVLNSADTIELQDNTNITGALVASGNITASGGTLTVGTSSQQGTATIHDGDGETISITIDDVAANSTIKIPDTVSASDTFCLLTLNNCSSGGPWTTNSNVVNLNTDTDSVTIGSATAGGKLFIDGDDAAEVQLQIQGASGQSANLLLLEQDGGTDVFTVSNAGNTLVAGLLTVQTGATISGATVNINASSNFNTNINTGTSTGVVSIGNNTGNTTVSIDSGTSAINIGTGGQARSIAVGTGGASQSVTIGSQTTTSQLNLHAGTNNINLIASGSSNTGVIVKNTSNSTSAFLIQNSGSDNLLRADATNNRIYVGNQTASSGADTTLLVVDSGTTANLPSGVNGGIIYDSTLNKFKIYENGAYKELCNMTDLGCGAGATVSLQDAYNNSTSPATIATTSSTKDIIFKSGSGFDADSMFQIQNAAGNTLFVAATDNMRVAVGDNAVPANGILTIGTNTTNAAGGMYFGTDTNLYRSNANELKTDDALVVAGTSIKATAGFIQSTRTSATDQAFSSLVQGESVVRLEVLANGRLNWSDGSAAADTTLYRSAADTLKTDDQLLVQTATNSSVAFQIQNAAGRQILNADTTSSNLLANPSFETDASGWAAHASSGAPARDTTEKYIGNASGKTAATAANHGLEYSVSLTNGQSYAFIAWVKFSATADNGIAMGRVESATDQNCTLNGGTTPTISTSGWTYLYCTFTYGGSTGATPVYIKQTNAVSRTIFVDGVQLINTSTITPYKEGTLSLNGIVNSPTVFQNQSNSTTSLQIQNAGSTETLFRVDTLNNRLYVGNATASSGADATLLVLDSTTTANLPTGVNGGIIYDSTVSKFKVYEGGQWKELCNTVDAGCGSAGATQDLQEAYDNSTSPATIETTSNTKDILFKSGSGNNSTGIFQIQSSASDVLFRADTTNNRVYVGNATASSSADSTLLVIDSSTTSNLPSGVNGGIIYDSTTNKFKIYENGAYKVLCNQTDLGCGSAGAAQALQDAYNNSSTPAVIETTSSTKDVIIKSGTGFDADSMFQIQAANGDELFVADTAGFRVAIGTNTMPANGVLSVGTNTTAATGGIYFGTDTNLYRSAAGVLRSDGSIQLGEGASRTFSVQGRTTNAAGNGLTISAGNAGTGGSAFVGGNLTLQGGDAAGTGNANGGDVILNGGTGVGTGVKGLIVVSTPTFMTTSNDANCYTSGSLVASSCTVAQASIDSTSAILVGFSAAGQTATMPDPTNTTAGRIIYITGANGSSDFLLSVNGGGTGNEIAMKANTSATMIWNGSDWTAAGASSSTTLQAAYNNTLTSAGGAEIILNNTASSNGLTIRNNAASPISGGIFEVQSSIGTNLFAVNNLGIELAANGGSETSSTWATDWTVVGSASVNRTTTSGEFVTGIAAAEVNTTAAANDGIRNNLSGNPATSTTYQVSFAAKLASGSMSSSLQVVYSRDGGTDLESCSNYSTQSLSNSDWTKITCTITTDSTTATNPDLIIRQTDSTSRNIWIENLSFMRNDSTTEPSHLQIGGGINGGPITLFTLDRSSAPPVADGNETYLGSMYYDTVTGRIQCYEADGWGACGSAPDNFVNLVPEYAGAVLNGSGVGTMTADFCSNGTLSVNSSLCASGQAQNFYRWTSPQSNQQVYSIYVTYQLPGAFKYFQDNNTVQLMARTDSTTNGVVTYQMYRSEGGSLVECGTETTVTTSANVWQTVSHNGSEFTGCGFSTSSANTNVVFKINVKAKSGANVYVGTLGFTTIGQ